MSDLIRLKWGTLKAWDLEHNFDRPEVQATIKAYDEVALNSVSAMVNRESPESKEALINFFKSLEDCVFHLDWDGKDVTLEEAITYVRNYGNET